MVMGSMEDKEQMDKVAEQDQWTLDNGRWSRPDLDYTDDNPLLRDVAFNNHERNAAGGWKHVSPGADSMNHVGIDGIAVKLIKGLPPMEEMAPLMQRAMNATTGHNVTFEDMDAGVAEGDWKDVLRGGLQTVMEAFVIVFEVSGASRTCTHQLVRSRRAGFHQQSQRATSFVGVDGSGANIRVPESVWKTMGRDAPETDYELYTAWSEAITAARKAYRLAVEAGVSYQDARFILPEGTENYIMCEYNLREFIAMHDYRACSMFQWEISHIVREMGKALVAQSPWIVGTGAEPKISCERTRAPQIIPTDMHGNQRMVEHMCTFQGWEKVEQQCGFDWALDDNRTFKPSRTI
jgi:thymidylate synthase (FAD)